MIGDDAAARVMPLVPVWWGLARSVAVWTLVWLVMGGLPALVGEFFGAWGSRVVRALLLGVVTTVALAWLCGAIAGSVGCDYELTDRPRFSYGRDASSVPEMTAADRRRSTTGVVAAGLPFRCLKARRFWDFHAKEHRWEDALAVLIAGEPRVLPLRPVTSGFVMNLLVATGVWAFVLAIPPVWRRRVRKRAGWCLRCGFDLEGRPDRPCPECGLQSAHA